MGPLLSHATMERLLFAFLVIGVIAVSSCKLSFKAFRYLFDDIQSGTNQNSSRCARIATTERHWNRG